MNRVFAKQRGKAVSVLKLWEQWGIEERLRKSHLPGGTVLDSLLMLISFYLSDEPDEILQRTLAQARRLMDAYWLGHSERRRSDGTPMPSDRADAELATYFIKSLGSGVIETSHLHAYVEQKTSWLGELGEIPPHSPDTDGIWRRMVLAELESRNLQRAEELLSRRRHYLVETGQYKALNEFFKAERKAKSRSSAEAAWEEYFRDARRRPAGCGVENAIRLDELLMVASLRESGLDGARPRDHWAALTAIRGPEEIEPE